MPPLLTPVEYSALLRIVNSRHHALLEQTLGSDQVPDVQPYFLAGLGSSKSLEIKPVDKAIRVRVWHQV